MVLDNTQNSGRFRQQKAHEFFVAYVRFLTIRQKIDTLLGQDKRQESFASLREAWKVLFQVSAILSRTQKGDDNPEEEKKFIGTLGQRTKHISPSQRRYSSVYDTMSDLYALEKTLLQRSKIPLDTSIFQTKATDNQIIPGNGEGLNALVTATKFDTFLRIARSLGLESDTWLLYEESLDSSRMRELPYTIIYLQNPKQTWCISDEVGQAIFAYEGHPRLDEIVGGKKGNPTSAGGCKKIEWSGKHEDEIIQTLQTSIVGIESDGTTQLELRSDLAMKLWAQTELMKAKDRLASIGMVYLSEGKWDLSKVNSYRKRNFIGKIGGKFLKNFPSGEWNKKHGIGDGLIISAYDIKDMLVSLGYESEKIIVPELNLFQWKEGMDDEVFKKMCRDELEKDEVVARLKTIGLIYLGDRKWDLNGLSHSKLWKNAGKIGGKLLPNFPLLPWNKKHGIGDKSGAVQSPMFLKGMLIGIGYKGEDIILQGDDPFRWEKEYDNIPMQQEVYKKKCRDELEKEESLEQLKGIGVNYLGDGKWDLSEINSAANWLKIGKIGGKTIISFPSASWNKLWIEGKYQGQLQNKFQFKEMLISIGYLPENIINPEEYILEWRREYDNIPMQQEVYKKKCRDELEKEESLEQLKGIGVNYLGDGKWDLSEINGSSEWKKIGKIGGIYLNSFPSTVWNNMNQVGYSRGSISSKIHFIQMLISIDYDRNNILTLAESKKGIEVGI